MSDLSESMPSALAWMRSAVESVFCQARASPYFRARRAVKVMARESLISSVAEEPSLDIS